MSWQISGDFLPSLARGSFLFLRSQHNSMEQAQFESAIRDLAAHFQTCKGSGRLRDTDYWQDVNLIQAQNLPSSSTSDHFLRITRTQTEQKTPTVTVDQQQEKCAADIQVEDLEADDDESLLKFTTSQKSTTVMIYDIIYSPTYCVPVLYTHKQCLPPDLLASIQGAGLSLVDHPITLKPVYFVHPCRTQEAVREILGDRQANGMEWLMVWFGVIGASAGLSVPLEVVTGL